MERWTEEEEGGGAGQVGQAVAVHAVGATVQHQSGVVLMLVKRDEVTMDWLSFFL